MFFRTFHISPLKDVVVVSAHLRGRGSGEFVFYHSDQKIQNLCRMCVVGSVWWLCRVM